MAAEQIRIQITAPDDGFQDFQDVMDRAIKAAADRRTLQAELRETRRVLAAVLEQQGGWVMIPKDRMENIPLDPVIGTNETNDGTGYVFRFKR